MIFALRLLARSRRLRAMGVLAWLMLVINALAAAPMGMTGGSHSHPMHASVAAASEHGHHQMVINKASGSCCEDQAGCSGGVAGHACSCTAMCGTTLLPAVAAVLIPTAITAGYAMPLPGSTPSLNTAPPLRPPAV